MWINLAQMSAADGFILGAALLILVECITDAFRISALERKVARLEDVTGIKDIFEDQ